MPSEFVAGHPRCQPHDKSMGRSVYIYILNYHIPKGSMYDICIYMYIHLPTFIIIINQM